MKKVGIFDRVMAILLIAVVLLALVGLCMPANAETAAGESGGTINLTDICVSLITLIFGLITTKLWPWIKARTSTAQQEGVTALAKTLVYAAEQLKKTGAIDNKLKYVEDRLMAAGYGIDRSAIEAAVTQLRNETGATMAESMAASGGVLTDSLTFESGIDGDALAEGIAQGIVKGITSAGGCTDEHNNLGAAAAARGETVQADDAAAHAGSGGLAAGADKDEYPIELAQTEPSGQAGAQTGGTQA